MSATTQGTAGAGTDSRDQPYRVEIADALDDATALALWANAVPASVFNHPAWWRAAIAAYGAGRRLTVICIKQGTVLVGLWPMWRKRLAAREGFARVIEPVGARLTDYCTPLLHRDHEAANLVRLMIGAVVRRLDAQTVLLLPKIPVAGPVTDAIARAATEQGLLMRVRDRSCLAMSMPPLYADLEKRWSSNHRSNVRRRVKRLNAEGQLSLVRARTRDDINAVLPRLSALHVAAWQSRTGYSDLAEGGMPRFLATLAESLPLDMIHATELHLNGKAISCHFGFEHDKTLLWYKPAFDIGWSSHAPGKVHVALLARHGIDEGLRKLDFMQGEEAYKQQWSDLTTATKSFALAHPMAYPIWAWNTIVRKFAAEYRH